MFSVAGWDTTLDALVHVAQIIGIPVAIALFFFSKRREQLDRERGTYDSLDEKYQQFLILASQHPDLPLVVPEDDRFDNFEPTSEQRYRLTCSYLVLTSILERAFLLYTKASGRARRSEWSGWNAYMSAYLSFRPYLDFWIAVEDEDQFHKDFTKHMKTLRLGDH